MLTPTIRRCAVVLAAGAAVLAGLAGPAAAHVEVEAQPARALATGAVVTMTAEAESSTAGIAGVRIQLPDGLVPADFTLTSGPAGWRASGARQVLQVQGPALPVGRSLRLSLRVRQLPAARQVVLKTIQSYSDGRQDSWIEVPQAGAPEPDSPAPVLRLAAAAPGATPLPREMPSTPAPTGTAPTTATSPTSTASAAGAAGEGSGGSNAVWIFVGAGIGAALLGGVVLVARHAGPRPG
ncbi:MAG: DUF1775 domain-containing protein [Mycobacteriales bacterium]